MTTHRHYAFRGMYGPSDAVRVLTKEIELLGYERERHLVITEKLRWLRNTLLEKGQLSVQINALIQHDIKRNVARLDKINRLELPMRRAQLEKWRAKMYLRNPRMPVIYNFDDPNVPAHAVDGSRSGPFGNPFPMRTPTLSERERAIAKYREWVMQRPEMVELIKTQQGKPWVCHCAPKRCHCEVNVEIANTAVGDTLQRVLPNLQACRDKPTGV